MGKPGVPTRTKLTKKGLLTFRIEAASWVASVDLHTALTHCLHQRLIRLKSLKPQIPLGFHVLDAWHLRKVEEIPQLGPRIPSETLRRFWTMLSQQQGSLLNAASLPAHWQ